MRSRNLTYSAALVAAAVGSLFTAVAATAAPSASSTPPVAPAFIETPILTSFFIDSFDANSASGGNAITSPVTLQAGTTYELRVSGTFSAWGYWGNHHCGSPLLAPLFPSPLADGTSNTMTGQDAVSEFAIPSAGSCKSFTTKKAGAFEVNLGNGWFPYSNLPGVSTAIGIHAYKAELTPSTTVTPEFRIHDWKTDDNDGQLFITVITIPTL